MVFDKYFTLLLLLPLFFITKTSTGQTNIPPEITAIGNQSYCPTTPINIATDIIIIDPDNTGIEAMYVQISTGYQNGEDTLTLTGLHPTFSTQWTASTGKLKLSGISGADVLYTDFIAAILDVQFNTTNTNATGDRFFSITIGDANYLTSTDHFYEFVSNIGITWTEAKTAAEARTYFGLQGYLATLESAEEAQLSGEQASGAGWIGGSDTETEGVWKWVTGPNPGTIFWNGVANGSTPNYANWNTGEPNQLGEEDYAHITDPSIGIPGAWNDLPNTSNPSGTYQAKGYIVEYGGMTGDPTLNISASTSIHIPEITSTTSNSRCGIGSMILEATSNSGMINWYDAATNGNLVGSGTTFTTSILNSSTTYFVSAAILGCTTIPRTPVNAIINPIPIINTSITLKNCDEDGNPDGFTDFNLNEATPFITLGDTSISVTYHLTNVDASAGINNINPSPFNNSTASTVFGRAENSFGCYEVSTVNLEVSTTFFPSGYIQELQTCDDDMTNDGLHTFNLTEATSNIINQFPTGQNLSVQYYRNQMDAHLEENEILPQNDYINETQFSQTLYVRIENDDNGDCFGIGPHLILIVHPRPEFEVVPTEIICLNLNPITIQIFNPSDNYMYQWTDENGTVISNDSYAEISTGGLYTAIGTSTDGTSCHSFPKTITVIESNIATITSEDVTIVDDSNNNTITINTNNLGIGDYEFALDNEFGSYQDESFFEMVSPGIHTIYVRDKNNCGIAFIEVAVIGFPKFFTPNNDGYNDNWQVLGVNQNFYPSSLIYIYDRFGKIIAKVNPTGIGWSGYYNGQMLPSDDYWFSVQLIDKDGNIRDRKGHFSLVRR